MGEHKLLGGAGGIYRADADEVAVEAGFVVGIFCLWAVAIVFVGIAEFGLGDGEIDWAEFQGGFWFDGWYPKIAIAVGVDVAGIDGCIVAKDVCRGAL